jgi:exosortase A
MGSLTDLRAEPEGPGGPSTGMRAAPDPHGRQEGRPSWLFSSAALVLGLCVLALALFWGTTSSMIETWRRSGTFAHGFLVFPISLWLIWRMRERLACESAVPHWPAFVLLALAGFVWLLGELASVISVSQFALVSMFPLTVWALTGTRVLKLLSFPLAFLVFAVPFGEFLLPTMMNWTADFVVVALRAIGVPVFREGNNFVIPTGSWSVVEACSGVRYLIASMVVGSLYAYLTYRSSRRRLLFFALSVAVPLAANWLRALIIVLLGHVSENRIATGVDHLIYGWVFFGVVMMAMFWIGSIWREDAPEVVSVGRIAPTPLVSASRSVLAAAGLAVIVIFVWRPIESVYASVTQVSDVQLDAPGATGGWVAKGSDLSPWRPGFAGATAETRQTYEKATWQVGVHIAFYRAQAQGRELVVSVNQVAPTRDKVWHRVSVGERKLGLPGLPGNVGTAQIANGVQRLVAWHWYWVDGFVTQSDYVAKALLVLSKLRGHGDDSALVVIYARSDEYGQDGDEALRDFAAAMGPEIGRALTRATGRDE